MKFADDRPYSDPEKAARKLLEIANHVEVVQDGRIYIELINGPFLFREKGTPEEYKAGLDPRLADAARERNLCEIHAGGRGPVLLKIGIRFMPHVCPER
jgi:hypothetical protein